MSELSVARPEICARTRARVRAHRVACVLACLAGVPTAPLAQERPAPAPVASSAVQQVFITGTAVERALADAPQAIGVVDADALRAAGPMVNLSEALAQVPGMTVASRSNYAQDLQISSRGFGARAGFGVRGIRLYTDGIPASGPDGQGQVSHVDLAGAARVEVLRGPFSVLYGNSSGGVISVLSAPVRAARSEAGLDLGSFGMRQLRAQVEAPLGAGLDLRVGAAAMRVDGFRPHSAARRDLANVRLAWRSTGDAEGAEIGTGEHDLLLLANHLDQPADDPLGLTRAQFDADPRQTTPQAQQFDTRKTTRQTQTGLRWRWRPHTGALRELQASAYGGQRAVQQFLAIAPAVQMAANHGGAVVDFDRRYQGAELRARYALEGVDLVAGLAIDRQRDARRGYQNFIGPAATPVALGVQGALRRDETNRAGSDDAYLLAEWRPATDWLLSGGLRGGRVALATADHYLANGDDSGRRRFSHLNPVLGLSWQLRPGWSLHASVARGAESPTLGELAYGPDGSGGFNAALQAQSSRQWEGGVKARGAGWQADVVVFEARTAQEIGVARNAGGRSSFQNVGRTLRRGLEASARAELGGGWHLQGAATLLQAAYRDGFLVCAGLPCTQPTVPVPAGNRIAGTAPRQIYGELGWRQAAVGGSAGSEWALEWREAGGVVVNDRNTDRSPAVHLLALRWRQPLLLAGGWRGEALLRVDNLGNRRWAGSVIVNEANGRHFEPGMPRSVLMSLRLIWL